MSVDGKVYGIPKNIVAMVIVYNKRLFDEAGIPSPPKTWEEFREVATKLNKPAGKPPP